MDQSQNKKLKEAVLIGNTVAVKQALFDGADVTAKDKSNRTALHEAACLGHIGPVRELLAAGADVTAKDKSNRTALHLAAFYGHRETVQVLLDHDADIINTQDKQKGDTALHLAAFYGYKDTVQVLLDYDSDINTQNEEGETARDLAKSREIADMIERAASRPKYGWRKDSNTKISHMYEACGRELTELFNFSSQERMTFSKNKQDGEESVAQTKFKDTAQQKIGEAAEQLLRQGGNDYTATVRKAKSAVKIGLLSG